MLGASVPPPSLYRPGSAVSSLTPDQRTVVIAAVGAVVLLAVLFWLRRRVLRPGGGQLLERLAAPEEITVLLHPNPDPDAMASGMAVKRLAEHAGTPATLQYPGQITRPENRAFRTVLDVDMDRVETVDDVDADTVVLVDHNRPRGFEGSGSIEPYAVIDHHPGDGTGTAFTDVRTDYGACATILTEYYEDLGAEHFGPDEAVPEEADELVLPSDLATGLLYGILSDTKHLTKGCSTAEFEAAAYLYPTVDEDRLDRIANPQIEAEVLDVKRRAIADREAREPFAVSDVGSVTQLDAIPQAADELIQLEGITAVVVLGDKDGTIHMSGRSRDDRIHMGRALQSAVDDIPMAGAGGHARMGGGQVSIDHMEGLGPSAGVTREDLHEKLFETLGT